MGQESRWAAVVYPLKELNYNSEQKEKNKWQGQSGPRVKMGYCCLPPERVELTVNSKKETNGRVKMGQESRWVKNQDGSRVKMGCCGRNRLLHPISQKSGMASHAKSSGAMV